MDNFLKAAGFSELTVETAREVKDNGNMMLHYAVRPYYVYTEKKNKSSTGFVPLPSERLSVNPITHERNITHYESQPLSVIKDVYEMNRDALKHPNTSGLMPLHLALLAPVPQMDLITFLEQMYPDAMTHTIDSHSVLTVFLSSFKLITGHVNPTTLQSISFEKCSLFCYLVEQYPTHVKALSDREKYDTIQNILQALPMLPNVHYHHWFHMLASLVTADSSVVHVKDPNGNIALHLAAFYTVPYNAIEVLVKAFDRSVEAKNAKGLMPYMLARDNALFLHLKDMMLLLNL